MMDNTKIDRINTLAHKAKSVGLTEEEKKEKEKGIEEKDEDSNRSKKAAIKSANGTKREASLGLKQEKRVHINESDFSLEEDSILESRSKKRTVVISDSD